MSLFENEQYQWRETFFVHFEERNRPTLETFRKLLQRLNKRYELNGVREVEDGHFESVSVISPEDFAAMDLSFVSGEDIPIQLEEMREVFDVADLAPEEQRKYAYLDQCDVRYDVYHFEQMVAFDDGEEEEMLDPGGLLLLLEHLAELCQGVAVDPQSGTFI